MCFGTHFYSHKQCIHSCADIKLFISLLYTLCQESLLLSPIFLNADLPLFSTVTHLSPRLRKQRFYLCLWDVQGLQVYAFSLCYLPGVGVLAMLSCFIGATYTFPNCSACDLVDKINLREERGSPDCNLPSGFIVSEVYCILIFNQIMNSFIIQEIIVCVCGGGVGGMGI